MLVPWTRLQHRRTSTNRARKGHPFEWKPPNRCKQQKGNNPQKVRVAQNRNIALNSHWRISRLDSQEPIWWISKQPQSATKRKHTKQQQQQQHNKHHNKTMRSTTASKCYKKTHKHTHTHKKTHTHTQEAHVEVCTSPVPSRHPACRTPRGASSAEGTAPGCQGRERRKRTK